MTIDLAAGGYATADDYAAWVSPAAGPTEDVVTMLRSATFLIAWACARNPYNDVPASSDAPPLRDATCAQVQAWLTLGVTPEDAGLAVGTVVKRASILGAEVENDTTGRLTALQEAAAQLAPVTESILLATNLRWQPTVLGDETPYLLGYGLSGHLPYGGGPQLAEQPYPSSWPWL